MQGEIIFLILIFFMILIVAVFSYSFYHFSHYLYLIYSQSSDYKEYLIIKNNPKMILAERKVIHSFILTGIILILCAIGVFLLYQWSRISQLTFV